MADISSIRAWAGLPFLAVVLGRGSWKIVGCAMATHLRTVPVEIRSLLFSDIQAVGIDDSFTDGWYATNLLEPEVAAGALPSLESCAAGAPRNTRPEAPGLLPKVRAGRLRPRIAPRQKVK